MSDLSINSMRNHDSSLAKENEILRMEVARLQQAAHGKRNIIRRACSCVCLSSKRKNKNKQDLEEIGVSMNFSDLSPTNNPLNLTPVNNPLNTLNLSPKFQIHKSPEAPEVESSMGVLSTGLMRVSYAPDAPDGGVCNPKRPMTSINTINSLFEATYLSSPAKTDDGRRHDGFVDGYVDGYVYEKQQTFRLNIETTKEIEDKVYYVIEVDYTVRNLSYNVLRRYSEFEALYSELRSVYPDVHNLHIKGTCGRKRSILFTPQGLIEKRIEKFNELLEVIMDMDPPPRIVFEFLAVQIHVDHVNPAFNDNVNPADRLEINSSNFLPIQHISTVDLTPPKTPSKTAESKPVQTQNGNYKTGNNQNGNNILDDSKSPEYDDLSDEFDMKYESEEEDDDGYHDPLSLHPYQAKSRRTTLDITGIDMPHFRRNSRDRYKTQSRDSIASVQSDAFFDVYDVDMMRITPTQGSELDTHEIASMYPGSGSSTPSTISSPASAVITPITSRLQAFYMKS